jgi:hypothetical protein
MESQIQNRTGLFELGLEVNGAPLSQTTNVYVLPSL